MNHSYSMRRAGTADATAVRELTRAAYAKWLPVIGREPKPMGADYEAAVKNHLIDLLIRNSELVGLVEMVPHVDHLLVENVAVAPAHQGQGLGHILMKHVEGVAEQGGHAEVRLYTHNRFEENIKLYLKLGYRVDSEDEIADGYRVNMSKKLHQAE